MTARRHVQNPARHLPPDNMSCSTPPPLGGSQHGQVSMPLLGCRCGKKQFVKKQTLAHQRSLTRLVRELHPAPCDGGAGILSLPNPMIRSSFPYIGDRLSALFGASYAWDRPETSTHVALDLSIHVESKESRKRNLASILVLDQLRAETTPNVLGARCSWNFIVGTGGCM